MLKEAAPLDSFRIADYPGVNAWSLESTRLSAFLADKIFHARKSCACFYIFSDPRRD